jgi:hypothetical protein
MPKLTAVTIVTLSILLSASLVRADNTGDASATTAKWEYARLIIANSQYTIETRDDVKTAPSAKELYFNAFGGKPTSVRTFSDDTLLCRIGDNGWELTGAFTETSTGRAVYVFKRPAK